MDDPEHTLRFTGQLKPGEGSQVTLAYKAMLITMVTTPTNAKQSAITSGEGAVILEFNKRMTISSRRGNNWRSPFPLPRGTLA